MQERLNKSLPGEYIIASTFHKLGKDIIAVVEQAQPSISPLAEDGAALQKQVDEWFEELLRQPQYAQLVVNYLIYYKHHESSANPFDFKTEGEYHEVSFHQ